MAIASILCSGSLGAQTVQEPAGHRLPNIGVGLNHHHDSLLCSRLNVGLRTEVDSLHGLQFGLFYGGIRRDAQGLMVAGIANAAHAMSGIQLAGFSNIVFTPMRGLQLSMLTNIAMGVRKGTQISTTANVSSGQMHGLQLGAYNYADTLTGSQIGIINVALTHPRGVQLGFFNYTRDTIARKIGLVNVNPKTRIDLLAGLGTASKLNAALRFRNRSTYSIVGVGSHYMGFDEGFSGAIYYRIGQYFTLSPRWTISGDLDHDFSRIPVEFTMTLGGRYLADNGGLFRGERLPYLSFNLEYGDPFEEADTQPYSYFCANVSMGFSGSQPLFSDLHLMGRLWSSIVYSGKEGQTLVGLFQHFNYYDSKPVKDGTTLTPYRISEAAAFGPGIIWQFPRVGNLSRLEQRLFADLILLGGTKSDYYNIIDRDYNMGSGFSLKTNTLMEFPRLGRFVLHVDYYRIFTWKGYEGKDLTTVNLLYLNAQGDRGNAELLVINPMFLFHLKHNLGIELAGAYYARNTHYKYHDEVRARTFEVRAGLVYRF